MQVQWCPSVRMVVLGLAASAAFARAGRADSDDRDRPSIGVVYVQSNDPRPGMNSILAYRSNPFDGSLTPLFGSPFPTRGTGIPNPSEILGPDDSDQEIIVSPDHNLLFSVNSGSNTIAVFRVGAGGRLTHVDGSPFPSGGVQPASVGLAGNRLYVVNKGDQAPGQIGGGTRPNYAGFHVSGDGRLSPISGSTVVLRPGSQPTQALIAPCGNLLFGIELFAVPFPPQPGLPPFVPPFASLLESLQIQSNGHLAPAPGTPQGTPPGFPPFALGLQAHPKQPILYAGFVIAGQLAVYPYNPAGRLTFAGAVPSSGMGICWIAVDEDGRFLYTSNSTDDSLSVFSLKNPLVPKEVQHLPLQGSGPPLANPGPVLFGTTPFQLTLDPTGRLLYVVNHETTGGGNPSGNALHVLRVLHDGTLAEPSFSPIPLPVPAVADPQGVVAL